MATTHEPSRIDQAEGMRLLDKAARQHLGISGAEFLARWDAGEFSDALETVLDVAVLMPLVRPPDGDESPTEFFKRLTSRPDVDAIMKEWAK